MAITGENLTERGAAPLRPFARGGKGWGGLLLSARYGELSVDSGSFPVFADPPRGGAHHQRGVSLGWSLNRALKIVLDYQNTSFEGGERAVPTGDRTGRAHPSPG